jgi:hypothetical protein
MLHCPSATSSVAKVSAQENTDCVVPQDEVSGLGPTYTRSAPDEVDLVGKRDARLPHQKRDRRSYTSRISTEAHRHTSLRTIHVLDNLNVLGRELALRAHGYVDGQEVVR